MAFTVDCFRSVLSHASIPAEERVRMGITDNLVRLSVGLEDPDDIIADLDLSLRSAVSLPYGERRTYSITTCFCTVALRAKRRDLSH